MHIHKEEDHQQPLLLGRDGFMQSGEKQVTHLWRSLISWAPQVTHETSGPAQAQHQLRQTWIGAWQTSVGTCCSVVNVLANLLKVPERRYCLSQPNFQ